MDTPSDLDHHEFAELVHEQQQAVATPGPKGKKRYTPPRPDAGTFDTQIEFVNSLVPIPLSSVEENNRRCSHCWKNYGDSDPGADNAEDPVKFRCGHVHGEKCMRELFKLPVPVKVELHPISFGPGSNGAKLGDRLEKFLAHKEREAANVNEDSTMEERLLPLLNVVERVDKDLTAASVLGPEWFSVIQQIVFSHHKLLKVHFLDNGVIYDIDGTEPTTTFLYPPMEVSPPHAMYGAPITSLLSLDGEISAILTLQLKEKTSASFEEIYNALNVDDSWDTEDGDDESDGPPSKAAPYAASPAKPKLGTSLNPSKLSSSVPISAPSSSLSAVINPVLHPTTDLPTPKSSPVVPPPHDLAISTLGDPSTAFSPIDEGFLSNFHPSVAVLETVGHSHTWATTPAKPIGEIYVAATKFLGLKVPDAVPLDTLEELKKKAENQMKMKAAANQKKVEAAKKRAIQAEAERLARRKEKFDIIASTLAQTIKDYRQSEGYSLSPSPPPPKKIKAYSPVPLQLHHPIHATATLHKQDIGSTHYNVPQPYERLIPEDDEDQSDSDGEDGLETGHGDDRGGEKEKNSQRMVVLVRSMCTASCCHKGDEARKTVDLGDPPETIGWKDVKSTPDSCPLCRKILFKRKGGRR